jgi:hypothetical protein
VTLEEYAAAQLVISQEVLSEVLQVTESFRLPNMNVFDWEFLLRILYQIVAPARRRSAELGRDFYDSEREDHKPNLPRHDVFLGEYRPEWFAEDMLPARDEFLEPDASDNALSQVALRAMKSVENGGRRQILRAVDEDDPQVVQGWARVATGRETCGFCMMLVSRGPVYLSARSAGLELEDEAAQDLIDRGDQQALGEVTRRFHPGCDCLIVPVFDKADWPGRDAYKRALAIWKRETFGLSGRDAMNAFRRAIENGDVDVREMSIAA